MNEKGSGPKKFGSLSFFIMTDSKLFFKKPLAASNLFNDVL